MSSVTVVPVGLTVKGILNACNMGSRIHSALSEGAVHNGDTKQILSKELQPHNLIKK